MNFEKDKYYIATRDLIDDNGKLSFKKDKPYRCIEVSKDVDDVTFGSETDPLHIIDNWRQYFIEYTGVVLESVDVEKATDMIYDLVQNKKPVPQELLEFYKDQTGKDKPGFML